MPHSIVFSIFYRTFFAILAIVFLALLVIPPADIVGQVVRNYNNELQRLKYIGILGGVYALTIILALIIWFSRYLTNRTVLKEIPKTFIPIEKGEVSRDVRRMIEAGLRRNAMIAWDSHPRPTEQPTTLVNTPEARDDVITAPAKSHIYEPKNNKHKHLTFLHRHSTDEKAESTVNIPPYQALWATIEHSGWSSPDSPNLPNLQYDTVIRELPHLIEARAVSKTPPDPRAPFESQMLDLRVIGLLQRPGSMGLREYVDHLISLGVLTKPATDFLATYERARFAPLPLTAEQFRTLMALFTDLLRDIQPVSPATLATLEIDTPESDIDADGSTTSTPRSQSRASSRAPSIHRGNPHPPRATPPRRTFSDDAPSTQYTFATPLTAPPLHWSRRISRSEQNLSRQLSHDSFMPNGGQPHNRSRESLQSSTQGSVIRLRYTDVDGELPYVLTAPGVSDYKA